MAETFEAYRTRVLSYLGDEEPIGVQQATPSQLDRRLRDVVPEELIRRPAPEKWSIAEIVAHLADAELAMGWRLRNMLANPGVALTWWDQSVWAERLGYAQQDASFSAGVFRALRESNLRLLESVPRARWVECYGVHDATAQAFQVMNAIAIVLSLIIVILAFWAQLTAQVVPSSRTAHGPILDLSTEEKRINFLAEEIDREYPDGRRSSARFLPINPVDKFDTTYGYLTVKGRWLTTADGMLYFPSAQVVEDPEVIKEAVKKVSAAGLLMNYPSDSGTEFLARWVST